MNNNSIPPPSMDELWHLALSTGWGDYYMTLPDNQLINDVPPITDLSAAKPWYSVWFSMEYVIHPPLYVQSLRFWRASFGGSDMTAISYSLFWSLVSVVLVYLIIRLINRAEIAFFAAIMMGVAPPEIYFGFEIRSYAMVTSIILLLFYLVLLIQKNGASRMKCVLLSILITSALLTHYLSLTACIICGILSLIYSRQDQRKHVVLAGCISAIIYLSIWMPFILAQSKHLRTADTAFLINHDGIASILRTSSLEILRLTGEGWYGNDGEVIIGATILLMIFVLGIIQKSTRPFGIFTLCVCTSILVQDIFQNTRITIFPRYHAVSFALLIPTIFAVLCNLSLKYSRQIGLCVLGCFFYFTWANHGRSSNETDSPSYYHGIQLLAPKIQPKETIIICYETKDHHQGRWIALELSHIPGLFPRDVILLTQPITPETRNQIRSEQAWLIPMYNSTNNDPAYWTPEMRVIEKVNMFGTRLNTAYKMAIR